MLVLGGICCGQFGQKFDAQAQAAGRFSAEGASRTRRCLGLLTPKSVWIGFLDNLTNGQTIDLTIGQIVAKVY